MHYPLICDYIEWVDCFFPLFFFIENFHKQIKNKKNKKIKIGTDTTAVPVLRDSE